MNRDKAHRRAAPKAIFFNILKGPQRGPNAALAQAVKRSADWLYE